MRKLLTLTCCVGLASLVGAAQHDDQDGNQGKKKGGQQQQQQQQTVAPQTGKKFKAGPGAGPHNQNFQQANTVGNLGNKGNKAKWQGIQLAQTRPRSTKPRT